MEVALIAQQDAQRVQLQNPTVKLANQDIT